MISGIIKRIEYNRYIRNLGIAQDLWPIIIGYLDTDGLLLLHVSSAKFDPAIKKIIKVPIVYCFYQFHGETNLYYFNNSSNATIVKTHDNKIYYLNRYLKLTLLEKHSMHYHKTYHRTKNNPFICMKPKYIRCCEKVANDLRGHSIKAIQTNDDEKTFLLDLTDPDLVICTCTDGSLTIDSFYQDILDTYCHANIHYGSLMYIDNVSIDFKNQYFWQIHRNYTHVTDEKFETNIIICRYQYSSANRWWFC